jgi:hypothetical protein
MALSLWPACGADGLSAVALRAPSPVAAKEVLFAKQTLDFVNPIRNEHPMNRLYASAMCTGGIAVGDVDGNGLPDIYCVSGPDRNALFLQTGDMVFTRTECGLDGGEAWGVGAAFADVDGDGDLDVMVCNHESACQLYLNESAKVGALKFREAAAEWGVNLSDAAHTPAFCDYDGDGDLDLYLMTNLFYDPRGRAKDEDVLEVDTVNRRARVRPGYDKYYKITKVRRGPNPGDFYIERDKAGRRDWLLRNDGGKFTDVTVAAGMSAETNIGLSATWWDYNGDGRPDLYVGDDFDDPDYFYRNDGGGKFTNVVKTVVPHTTWFSMGADFGDLNNDGWMDFLIGDMFGTNHYKQKVSMGPMGGKTEFLTTTEPRQYMRNALYVNTGTGQFMEAAQLTRLDRTNWTWAIQLQDFDNDGWADVFVTNGMSRDYNDSDNELALDFRYGETEWQRHLRAKTPALKEENLAFRNKGGVFEFENVSTKWGLDHMGMSFAAASADLDRDGDLDLVVVNLEEPVFIYRNQSQDGARVLVQLQGGKAAPQGVGATITVEAGGLKQTRQLTLMRGYLASHEPVAHFALGKAQRIERMEILWPNGKPQEFKDLAAGQFYTVKEPEASTFTPEVKAPAPLLVPVAEGLPLTHRETPFDDFIREPLLPNKLSQLGPGLAVADVDGDGDDDVFQTGAAGQAGQLLLNDGSGKFSPAPGNTAFPDDLKAEDLGALFFDADGDGDVDLLVAAGGVEVEAGAAALQDRLYLNDGKGQFTSAPEKSLPAETDSGSVLAAADFDRDGDLDVFAGGRVVSGAYPATPRSHFYLNDGKGRFTDAGETHGIAAPGLVTGALWSDADGDGWLDLFITCEWGPVKFYRNDKGKLNDATAAAGLAALTGWWNGIAGRDLDGDGDMDYCVTNFGLNTKYHASPGHPTLLYYGDFDGSGKKQLVEAEYEDKTVFPVRGRSCSSQAMPFIRDKFSSYKSFAVASLSDIYTDGKLKQSDRFAAEELRSGILRNDGKGRFTFAPLPRLAQFAPGFGVVLTDLNEDGHPDIFMAQNFWSPQPETGRMDGGLSLVLLGSKDGEFRELWPAESGVVIPRDAKSLVEGEFFGPGKRGWLVGINDSSAALYRLRTAESNTLTVRGLTPGTRVTAEYTGGARQSAESASGSGYLSQSAASLSFGNESAIQQVIVQWPDGSRETRTRGQWQERRLQLTPPSLLPE